MIVLQDDASLVVSNVSYDASLNNAKSIIVVRYQLCEAAKYF